MSKIAVVYWSGTGNTEAMAQKVVEGAKEAGAEVDLYTASEFSDSQMEDYDAVAFGCPSMGSEQLEDSEFEPMFNGCEGKLKDKKIALFGSYGWGDGEWMRNWEEQCASDGAVLIAQSVICNDAPDEDAQADCAALGKALKRKQRFSIHFYFKKTCCPDLYRTASLFSFPPRKRRRTGFFLFICLFYPMMMGICERIVIFPATFFLLP